MYINKICLDAKNFLSKDKDTNIRFLCVEKDSVVATDGKILVKIDTVNPESIDDGDNGAEERVLLPADVLNSLNKMVEKEEYLKISKNEDKVIVDGLDSGKRTFNYKIEKIDEKYAKYEHVFPSGSPQLNIQLSIDLLKKVIDFAKKYTEKSGDSRYIFLSFYGRKEPVIFRFESENQQKIKGLIMPAVDDNKLYRAEGKDAIIEGLCELIDKKEIAEALYSATEKEETKPSVRKCMRVYKKARGGLVDLFTDATEEPKDEQKLKVEGGEKDA